MYAEYFGLKQEPFSIAPDPRLLFMSEQHREALAHLLYGVQGGGGFVLLTGEIGTGKTTVCRSFLEQVPKQVQLAYIFNPKLTVLELLETVCHEFGVPVNLPTHRAGTVKDYLDPLNEFLLQSHAAGRNSVLVIDEAQNLAPEVLEQLRLLTNLETSERKLLQIILIGQPELRDMLARPELEQLAQRVIARYHLRAMAPQESELYVRHRLEACGLQRPLPFNRAALRSIHAATGGVPRRINLLCDRALLGAYANGQGEVTRRVVRQAAAEVFPRGSQPRPAWSRTALTAAVALVAGAGLLAAATRVVEPLQPARVALGEKKAGPASAAAPRPGPLSATVAVPATASTRTAMPPAVAVPVKAADAPRPPALLRDENAAWRELAALWKLPLPQGQGGACAALAREQVHCFSKNLSLPVIRQLGRPGIVTLDSATGQPSYAVLVALTDQTATLAAAGTEQTVTLTALAQRWAGDFATLWRAPEGYRGDPRDGQGGPAVDWVALQLASARGEAAPQPAKLDPALRNEVRAFQVAQGLPADGRPGPLTYMQLNRAAGVDEPRLRTQP
ncbi:AAA family ATPase [Ramlibacter ginsenosidimutans]|uniref:AAA family ATPase n=1 Tax=Ramlibacter ginsenosidimutans TaxID=502333 RepID=A0A934WNE0_9BURK|nr:ExeA family protein [Ramlibacter ginsenosidimutans]MBK6007458.1 AAA family ATPase [Ramlibacter ginsenosidimutans]